MEFQNVYQTEPTDSFQEISIGFELNYQLLSPAEPLDFDSACQGVSSTSAQTGERQQFDIYSSDFIFRAKFSK